MDWNENTVADVNVQTTSNQARISNMMTQEDGHYSFELPMNNNYEIQPFNDEYPLNGVSTFDLVLISKHILGINSFANPYQYIAADVNQSGSITAFDMVQLRRLILNIDTHFQNNTSWKFVESAFTFDMENPAEADYPTLSSVQNLAHDMAIDFIAVKIGDVNGNARTNSLQQAESRRAQGSFTIETANIDLKAGQSYTLEFTANELRAITGYQFTLDFGSLQFEQLQEGIAKIGNFGLNNIEKGYITTSWNQPATDDTESANNQLFKVELTATEDGKLSEQLSIISRPTAVEAYSQGGELLDVKLTFNTTERLSQAFEIFQNQPNPFDEQTNISFFLPETSEVELTLMDEMGRTLRTIKTNKAAGIQSIDIKSADLPSGLIYYQISTKYGTQTRKMLHIE